MAFLLLSRCQFRYMRKPLKRKTHRLDRRGPAWTVANFLTRLPYTTTHHRWRPRDEVTRWGLPVHPRRTFRNVAPPTCNMERLHIQNGLRYIGVKRTSNTLLL